MKRPLGLLALVLLAGAAKAQTFSDFLVQLETLPDTSKPAVVDSFFAVNPHTPYFEDDTVCYFLYRGTGINVKVHGDMTDWAGGDSPILLSKISGTKLFYAIRTYPADARLDYRFEVDGIWMNDPKNPNTTPGGFGTNSELRMPQYVSPPELSNPDIPHGSVSSYTFDSDTLLAALTERALATSAAHRNYKVYLPAGYDSTLTYSVLFVHDGYDFINMGLLPQVLDYLIHYGIIEPLVAVLVPSINRTPEYADLSQHAKSYNYAYAYFIAEELGSYIDSTYSVSTDPTRRAVMGPSYAGNASYVTAFLHPDRIGNTAPYSPYVEPSMLDSLDRKAAPEVKIYTDMGDYDISVLIPLFHDQLVPRIEAGNYDAVIKTWPEGHSWGNWRAHVDEALKFFFPGPNASAPEFDTGALPNRSKLLPNWPNPFNGTTTIQYQLVRSTSVSLTLFDLLGRKIRSLDSGMRSAGLHQVSISTEKLSSGVYFAALETPFTHDVRKLTLVR